MSRSRRPVAGWSALAATARCHWVPASMPSSGLRRPRSAARARICRPDRRCIPARSSACCSMAQTRRSCSGSNGAVSSTASRCLKPVPTPTCRWAHACTSASNRTVRPALPPPLPMPEATATAAWYRRLLLGLLLAPVLLWLFGLISLRHVALGLLSLRERVGPRQCTASLAQYRPFFQESLYWHVFVRTALLSALATALTLLVAFPIAWTIAKLPRGRASALLFVVCLIPFWVSETVRTLGWMILLRESGVLPSLLVHLGLTAVPVEMLYHDATILVGLVYTSLLFMVVPLVGSLESLDNSLIEAAYNLGGKGAAILREIVIPHAAPGITAGCIVVFMLTLGNYLTPTLLGGKNSLWFTEQIYTQFITRFIWEQGAALGFLLLALSTAMVCIGLKVSGQRFSVVMRRT